MSPSAPLHALKVLLVEADPVSRTSLSLMLRKRGAEVVAVRSATEALAAIRQFNPHLYLINLRLPYEDGRSFIRRIRALPPEQGGSTPAIALTPGMFEDEKQSLVAGFQVQLMQPF